MGVGWRRLLQTMAVGGMGLSLYAGWLTVDDFRDRASSEHDIAAACGGLVPGAAVMDLQGGVVRAKAYEGGLVPNHPGSCTVYRVNGPHDTKALFTLESRGSYTVARDASAVPTHIIGDDATSSEEPFDYFHRTDDRRRDATAIADRAEPRPLGDGTLGWYGDSFATARAECGPSSRSSAPARLTATARVLFDDVSAADRERLATLARTAVRTLADRTGCATHLPALPDRLPPAPTALRPAKTATGACQWLVGHLTAHGQDRLPDRVLDSPVGAANPQETCLMAASPDQVRRITPGLDRSGRTYARSALTHSPWWLRTASYFGVEAGTVGYKDSDADRDTFIKPGTAGGKLKGIWWASSVCDGKPALHTLTSSYTYDGVLGSRTISALFRAYVDDITTRRGCTQVTFPDAKDFHVA
ncbi:hypothetical protein [Streptomyces sp. cg35]|uniref:hypothetical protein n=1 Tax=Streptomyces sp. cg35 TaxID=3421650 RepID=UPI003D1763A8